MKVIRWCIGLSLVSLVPLACGSSFSTVEAYKPTVSDVPYNLAQYSCSALQKCSSHVAELVFGPNDCVTLLSKRFEAALQPSLDDAVRAGTMKFDGSKLAACLTKIEALGCAALDNVYVAACESALGGTVAYGGSCAFDGECKGDAYCQSTGTCPGKCAQREMAGAACRDDAACQAGDKCFEGKCTQRIAAGAACTQNDVGCSSGFVCGPDVGSGRTCVAMDTLFVRTAGDDCSLLGAELCEQDSYCAVTALSLQGATMSCVGQASHGGACNFSYPDMCPSDQYCSGTDTEASTPVIEGNCGPLPTQGEPCTGLAQPGRLCAEDHVCVKVGEGNKCHKLQQNGRACAVDADCYSEHCVGTICAPKADCEVGAKG